MPLLKYGRVAGRIILTGAMLMSQIACSQSDDSQPLKILPLGDSITQAEVNRASYRYPLWKKLIDTGIEFDFVGTMDTQLSNYSKGTPPQPAYKAQTFDPDHEGHFAWQISDIVNGRNPDNGTGSGKLAQWLTNYDFDIALVHLGSNDAFYRKPNQRVADELTALIEILREDNPNAIILLAQVIPTSRREADALAIENMNKVVPAVVKAMNSKKSPVILVDQFTGFDASTETYDGVHPNAEGEIKIAARWFDAILDNLPH